MQVPAVIGRIEVDRAVLRSVYVVATMVKPVFRVGFGHPFRGLLDDRLQGVAGAGLGGAEPGFELAEGQFDGIEVGRVRRQVEQAGPAG